MLIATSSELIQSEPIPTEREILMEGVSVKLEEIPANAFTIDLAPVPDQQLSGPTAEDSSIYDLRGELPNNVTFNTFNFEVVIFTYQIHIPIFNRVYLFPFFDGGGGELGSPISAQVGKLFPVRGSGVLFAARIEITIVVTVMVIITIDFPWLYGGFNEFPEQFPNAAGAIISGVIIDIDIILIISFLTALVLPNGSLRLLFVFNLTIGIDFTISSDGRHLNFVPNFTHSVRFFSILPFAEQFPCGGRFQLADDNGQTIFIDSYGGRQSYYFAHSAGVCCVPWTFNLELVRFNSSGNEQIIQTAFNASMCLNAAPSSHLINVIITSVPPPQGIPATLTMDLAGTAIIKALAQRVDEAGNPTGEPPQDLRDLGYGVDFFLPTLPQVLNQSELLSGNAYGIEVGDNIIRAAVTSEPVILDDELGFWFGGILGFNILQYLEQGQEPRFNVGGLPVSVNPLATAIRVEPTLAYRDANGQMVASPNSEIERYEPFETQREYVLAVKLTVPAGTSFPQTIRFKVKQVQMRVLPIGTSTPQNKAPLDIPNALFGRNRIRGANNVPTTDPQLFFTGTLLEVNREFSITINSAPNPNDLIAVAESNVMPNKIEVGPSTPSDAYLTRLVPPGRNVGNRDVLLNITFERLPSPTGANTYFSQSELKLKVVNDETFEEYLRVFVEVKDIILSNSAVQNAKLRKFAEDFYSKLNTSPPLPPSPPDNTFLIAQGKDLWAKAVDFVQGSNNTKDDRVLYYIRLQSIAALRSHYRRNNVSTTLSPEKLNMFEWSSRGLETTDGINASIIFSSTTARKVIVTGYDPFYLPELPDRSNPSGLLALELNNKQIGEPQALVDVKTAIIPVRYKDFDEGLIQKITQSSIGSIVIFLTTSQQSINFYSIDRFASERRQPSVSDNLNVKKTGYENAPGADGADFLENTLPYEFAITVNNQQMLEGPNGNAGFVINQSYRIFDYLGSQEIPGKLREHPIFGDLDAYTKLNETPEQGKPLNEGSGGGFLSNEIFYRVAFVRSSERAMLPSGHLHIPPTGIDPRGKGPDLIIGSKKAINELLKFSYLLKAENPWNVDFLDTVINTNSQTTRTITNTKKSPVTITFAELNPQSPFAFQLPSPLPISVPSEGNFPLIFTFAPTAVGNYSSKLTLKDGNGEVVLITTLKGTAILTPPPPLISDFNPFWGPPGTIVSIFGSNFTDVISVRLGGVDIGFSRIDSTQISAFIGDAPSGLIEVETLHGTAISDFVFIVTDF